MSTRPPPPPKLETSEEPDSTPGLVPGRPLWQQFLIGAIVVLLIVGVILLVVRVWAVPALQSRGADAGVAGEATLGALQTQEALTPRPTATSAVAPVVQPTAVPTNVPTPAVTTAPAAVPTPIPTVQPTAAPTAAAVAQPVETATAATSATAPGAEVVEVNGTPVLESNGTPVPLPTAAPDVAAAVSGAYLQYWSVRSDALLNLDPTGLDQVAAGDELSALNKDISDLSGQGKALKTDVEHHMSVLTVFDDKALVSDRIRDSSVFVSPDTLQPLTGQPSPDQAPETTIVYELALLDGTWKVING
jgi:hypothetical protein